MFSLGDDDPDIPSDPLDPNYLSFEDLEIANNSDDDNDVGQDPDEQASEFSRPEPRGKSSAPEAMSPYEIAALSRRSPPPAPPIPRQAVDTSDDAPRRPSLEAMLSSEAARERRRRPSQDVITPPARAIEPKSQNLPDEVAEQLMRGYDEEEEDGGSSDEEGEALLEFRANRRTSRG